MVRSSRQRREREKLEIQRRILDAAREILAEEGPDAVTMRAVAERVEYTPAALYFHFRDKGELVERLCAEDYAALGARFQVLARVPDPLDRLRMAARAYVTFALEHPHHYRLVFLTPPAARGRGDRMDAVGSGRGTEWIESYLLRTVTDAAESGLFRRNAPPAERVARAVWEGIHGLVALEIVSEGTEGGTSKRGPAAPPVEERVETMVGLLLDGVLRDSR